MTTLDFDLERTVVIRARPATVFRFFVESECFGRWWGQGSTIDPRPGGEVRIVYPNGIEAGGEVVELVPEERIVFTFGYASGQPIPPGSSRVTVSLAPTAEGTRVRLRHELPDAETRDAHIPGWRYQLAVFANVAAEDEHRNVADLADRWFAAWSEADAARRREILEEVTEDDVAFRDAFGCLRGRDELVSHIGAVRMHLRGARFGQQGECRQVQGTALVGWKITRSDGDVEATGTNVVELSPRGRIRSVVGFRAD